MKDLEAMYQYATDVVASLQSTKLYDADSDADDQALVAYTFGVLNGYAQKKDYGAEDIQVIMVRLISEYIGYPVDYAQALTEFVIACTNREENESIYIIIHKGLDRYLAEGSVEDFKNEYTQILSELKSVLNSEEPPKRVNLAAKINPKQK